MLDSIATIGKSLSSNPLDSLVDVIPDYVSEVFVIEFDGSCNHISVDLEVRDSSNESKYLYKYAKEGIRPGKFLTCVIPEKDLDNLRNNVEIDKFRDKYVTSIAHHHALRKILAQISKDKKNVSQKNTSLLRYSIQEIIFKQNLIVVELQHKILKGDFKKILLTYKIDNKYLGEIDGFPWLLEQLSQGDKSLISKTLKCIICRNAALQNRLKEQLPFFNIDKKTFIPDGDDIINSAKTLPLCSTCYDDLKNGINYIMDRDNQLNYDVPYIYQKEGQIHQRAGKLRFLLIPQLNDLTDFSFVQDYLMRPEKGLSSFKSLFELSRDMKSVQKLRAQKLDRTVLSDGDKIMNLLTFTVLFYTYDKFQHMRLIEAVDGVYPRRLEELAQCKRDVDRIAEKTGNVSYPVQFYFGILVDFLQYGDDEKGMSDRQKDENAGWMKKMSYIMALLFTNKQLDETRISSILLAKAQLFMSKRKLHQWYEIMLKATLTLEYLHRVGALSNLSPPSNPEMPKDQFSGNDSMIHDASLFLTSHSGILRNNHMRGICAIGIMVGITIKAQMRYLDSDSAPFVSQLNRLEMDFDRLISMPRRVWPRLKYYDAEEFDSLFAYLLDSEIANINLDSPDLKKKEIMNLIFAIGMAHGFSIFDKFDQHEKQVEK